MPQKEEVQDALSTIAEAVVNSCSFIISAIAVMERDREVKWTSSERESLLQLEEGVHRLYLRSREAYRNGTAREVSRLHLAYLDLTETHQNVLTPMKEYISKL